jgi:hypothetical protein
MINKHNKIKQPRQHMLRPYPREKDFAWYKTISQEKIESKYLSCKDLALNNTQKRKKRNLKLNNKRDIKFSDDNIDYYNNTINNHIKDKQIMKIVVPIEDEEIIDLN